MKPSSAVVLALCLPAAAFAQGRIDGVYCNGSSGTAAVFDPNIDYGPGNLGGPVSDGDMDVFGLDKSASISFDYNTAPYSGRMGGHSNISYGPAASPGIGGSFSDIYFDGDAFSRTSGGQEGYTGNFTGSSIISMYFTVDQATPWSWSADVSGQASGEAQASYQIYLMPMVKSEIFGREEVLPSGPMIVYDILSAEETGSFDSHVEQSGTLEPGLYAMRISVDANAGLWDGPGAGEASVTLANGIFHLGGPVPAPTASGLLLLAGAAAARRVRRA